MRSVSIFAVLTLAACALLPACAYDSEPSLSVAAGRAGGGSVKLTFSADAPLRGLDILSSDGLLIQSFPLPDLAEGQVFFPGPAGSRFSILARTSDGRLLRRTVRIEQPAPDVCLRPLIDAAVGEKIVLPEGGQTVLLLQLDPTRAGARSGLQYRVELAVRGPLEIQCTGGTAGDGQRVTIEGRLLAAARPIHRSVRARAPSGSAGSIAWVEVKAELDAGSWSRQYSAQSEVEIVCPEVLRSSVKIRTVTMPTWPDGRPKEGLQSDFLELRPLASEEQTAERASDASAHPVSHQRIEVLNDSGYPLAVQICARVVDASGRPADGFSPPASQPGRSVQEVVVAPSGRIVEAVLPIYVGSGARPGLYSRVIEARLAGSDLVLDTRIGALHAQAPAFLASTVTAVAVVATVAAILVASFGASAFLRGFTTRQIVLIALIAAASVVLVNVPVFLLTNVTLTLLGPMGFLIDALLSELLFSALVVALLALAPRRGVCALVVAVRFLLGGALLAMLTPLGAIHAAVSALLLEAAVLAGGLERSRRVTTRFIVLFALASGLISFVGFQLSITLFRIHYAGWYVALSVGVGGVLYSLVGAALGRSVGGRMGHVMA